MASVDYNIYCDDSSSSRRNDSYFYNCAELIEEGKNPPKSVFIGRNPPFTT